MVAVNFLQTNKRLVLVAFRLAVLLLMVGNANGQTVSYLHSSLAGSTLPSFTPNSPFSSVQKLRVDKRKLKATLDMGDIYTLGSNTWSVKLKITFTAKTASNATLNTYVMDVTTTPQQPEKTFVADYTSLGTSFHHFDISINTYTNTLSYTQQKVRLTLSAADEIAYSTVDLSGTELNLQTPTVEPVPAASPQLAMVKFKWSNPTGAKFDYYDLQVLKVEPNGTDIISYPNNIVIDWSRAQKIEVDGAQEYSMTLSEGTGYYFWRVRPVGTFSNYKARSDAHNFGKWSSVVADGILTSPALTFINGVTSSLSNVINIASAPIASDYFYYNQFNDNINWIYGKVLTEGSRQAETMTFANGLNQSQQVQTKSFSQNQVLGMQSVYDFSGRPALKSLPAPVNSSQLGYKQGFFPSNAGTPYAAPDFDEDDASTLSTNEIYFPKAIGGGVGTPNNYYSGSNTIGVKKDFVPDAHGFPYSRTLYYSDATGRVLKQSGAGQTMNLQKDPAGHNITTLYGSVSQDELDRIFGTEAPIDTTTYKVVTIDPHHINTVTYMAKAGQTIATCLSNAVAPTNLEDVGNEGSQTVTDKFAPGAITPGSNFSRTSKSVVVDENARTINLDYKLYPAEFNITCENFCYTCDYKVEISIVCPQEPFDINKNVKFTSFVDPSKLMNCMVTGTYLDIPALASAAHHPSLTGPGNTIGNNLLSITSGTVILSGPETYIIEKKVYVNNTDASGTPYIDLRLADLRKQRDSWTAQSNCCGPITVDASGFNCTPDPNKPNCGDDAYVRTLYKFVQREQEATFKKNGATVTYKSQLSSPSTLTGNGYYSGPGNSNMTNFKGLITTLMKPPYNFTCTQISDCFHIYAGFMERNISLGAGNSSTDYTQHGDTPPTMDVTTDLMKNVFTCLGYDPNDYCRQYLRVINYNDLTNYDGDSQGLPDVDQPGTIRVWYMGMPGRGGSGPLTGPPTPLVFPPGQVSKDIEINNPNNQPAGGPYTASYGDANQVNRQTNCVQAYTFPNPLTNGLNLNSDAEKRAYLAAKVCGCLKGDQASGTAPTPPGDPSQHDAVTGDNPVIRGTCEKECDSKRLSFIQALENYVNKINFAAGLLSPNDPGWQKFEDLFPGQDKDCIADAMVAQCKGQCNMPTSFSMSTRDMSDMSAFTSPNGTTYSNFLEYMNSDEFHQIVDDEQRGFEQSMIWNTEVVPLGSYSQAGTFSVIKDDIVYFIEKSIGRGLNLKPLAADRTLNNPRPGDYPVSLSAPPLSGNASVVYHQEHKDFVIEGVNPGDGVPATVVTNVIWNTESHRMLEMNVAIYCASGITAYYVPPTLIASWSYTADPSCKLFQNFVPGTVYVFGNLFKVSFDKQDELRIVALPNVCNGIVNANNVCTDPYAGTFKITVNSGAAGQDLMIEAGALGDMKYLYSSPVKWNTSAIATASAIANAINTEITNPDYKASNLSSAGVATSTVSIFVPTSISYDPQDIIMKLSGTLPTTTVALSYCSTPLKPLLQNGCSVSTVDVQECPYGFKKVTGSIGYTVTPSGQQAMMNYIINYFYAGIETAFATPGPTFFYSSQADFYYGGKKCSVSMNIARAVIEPNNPTSQSNWSIAMNVQGCFIGVFSLSMSSQGDMFPGYTSTSKAKDYTPITFDPDGNLHIHIKANAFVQSLNIYNGVATSDNPTQIRQGSQFGSTLDAFQAVINQGQAECEVAPEACAVCMRWVKPGIPIEPDPVQHLTCDDLKKEFINNQVGTQLDQCLERKLQELKDSYKNSCLYKIKDDFSISYLQNNHHYTLYYYDRAKNLIKTVPPAGVEFVTPATVQAHRATPSAYNPYDLVPAHRLITFYTYNSIKQLCQQKTPDGNITKFWYNAAGQLILSQDAQQAIDKTYAYSKYDALGRVIETGKLTGYNPTFKDAAFQIIDEFWIGHPEFPDNITATRSEVVRTLYTLQDPVLVNDGVYQKNLRNRVSSVIRYNDATGKPKISTYYSYDPHGNVEWLIQQMPGIGRKMVRYEYDLVSGKVKKVFFNENTPESFIHRYEYDADNRITQVFTSTDGITWDRDSKYEYYLHGPLSRTEIGEDQLQGLDYAYTIEGYLKAVNQPDLNPAMDPSRDGNTTNDFLKDEFGMELGYYKGDYDRAGSYIGADANIANTVRDPYASAGMTSLHDDLFNGNISYWMSNIRDGNTAHAGDPMGLKIQEYRYDKLNRLRSSDFRKYNGGFGNTDSSYDEVYKYDPNGNIIGLSRYAKLDASHTTSMDRLSYKYKQDANGKLLDNRLYHIKDASASNISTVDIDDEGLFTAYNNVNTPNPNDANINKLNNYRYDAEGNLVQDIAEGIAVTWNLINKVAAVRKMDNTYSPAQPYDIKFEYDGMGNRVIKRIQYVNLTGLQAGVSKDLRLKNSATYYVRDASGNVMGIYTKKYDGTNTTYSLDELPLYGSSRLGEYRPYQTVQTIPGYVDDDCMIRKSTSSEMVKWLVPTTTGVKLVDFSKECGTTVTSLPAPSNAGRTNNAAIELDQNDNVVFGAFAKWFDNVIVIGPGTGGGIFTPLTAATSTAGRLIGGGGTVGPYVAQHPEWKLVGKNLLPMTQPVLLADAGPNATPVIVKNPANPNQYYYFYQTNATGFRAFRYVLVDMTLNSGNGGVVGTTENIPQPANLFGRKIASVTYKNGNSRLYVYNASPGNAYYLIYSIDITTAGIQAPVLQASVRNNSGNAITEDNDIAISPDGSMLAISLFTTATANTSYDGLALMDLTLSCGTLSNIRYYKVLSGKVKHLEFTKLNKYLYYSNDVGATSSGFVGRIDLSTGISANVTTGGSGAVDMVRSISNGMALDQNVGNTLQNLLYAESNVPTTNTDNIALGATIQNGLPHQRLNADINMSFPSITRRSEFNNWIASAKTGAGTSGVVDVSFALSSPSVSNSIPANLSSYHNVSIAEDANAQLMFKFFVDQGTGVPYLLDKNNKTLAGPVSSIAADPAIKSIVAKMPGKNNKYYLITAKFGFVYYHIIDMDVKPTGFSGSLVSTNFALSLGGTQFDQYETTRKQVALAVYNDTRTEINNKLYVATAMKLSGSWRVTLYQHQVTDIGIGVGTQVRQWTAPGDGTAELGEMHLSPNFRELAIAVTDPAPLVSVPSTIGMLPVNPAPTSNLRRINLNSNVQNQIQVYQDDKFETELRRGLNSNIYVNQLPFQGGSIIIGPGGGGGIGGFGTGTTTSTTGTVGFSTPGVSVPATQTVNDVTRAIGTPISTPATAGDPFSFGVPAISVKTTVTAQATPWPYVPYVQTHKHSIHLFTINPDNTTLTYKTEKVLSYESVGRSINANSFYKVLSFDYTNPGNYLYYVQVQDPTNAGPIPAIKSRLMVYSNTEAPAPSSVVRQPDLLMNTGVDNFGLPLHPDRIYGDCNSTGAGDDQPIVSIRNVGKKVYELNDHLGNVRVTMQDYRDWTDANVNSTVDLGENKPVLNQWADYYAFGSQISERTFSSPNYRFGFNGKEKDDEVKGAGGTSYDYGARMYDPRVGRWMSTDPKESDYPSHSSYNFVLNTPISAIDEFGEDVIFLVAKNGAGGNGHMAALIQDKEGSWYYISQGATTGGRGSSAIVGMVSGLGKAGMTIEKLPFSQEENALNYVLLTKNENSQYTSHVKLETSKSMDAQIYKKALRLQKLYELGLKRYNLITQNCVDAVQQCVEAGGASLPIDVDPRPNQYFDKLQKKIDKVQAQIDKRIKKEEAKEQKRIEREKSKEEKSKEEKKEDVHDTDKKD